MAGRYVAYYRVSTQKQGASGLGLEAQRQAVAGYIQSTGGELVGDFEEIESGKRSDRPELLRAIKLCHLTGARLVIAKLDRLSRNVRFLAELMEGGVQFVACDMPEANELTIHIMAAVAQAERKAISERTKAALGAIRGKLRSGAGHVSSRSGKAVERLGNPRGLSVSRPDLGAQATREQADAYARKLGPVMAELKGAGLSLGGMAARLSKMRVTTQRGGAWTAMGVKRILDRLEGLVE